MIRHGSISLPAHGLMQSDRAFQPGFPVAIAIVGGSGSGKSWLADRLAAALQPNAVRLSLDNFYYDRSYLTPCRRRNLNFDHPRAVDWEGFEKVLRDLLDGRNVQAPVYDFATHTRRPNNILIKAKPIIVAEGLWLLNRRSLGKLFTLRVFIDCSASTRLRRRLGRDCITRGRTWTSIRKQFLTTVEPMHRKFIAPQKERADLVLSEGIGLRELRLLKSTITALRGQQQSRLPTPPPRAKFYRRVHWPAVGS